MVTIRTKSMHQIARIHFQKRKILQHLRAHPPSDTPLCSLREQVVTVFLSFFFKIVRHSKCPSYNVVFTCICFHFLIISSMIQTILNVLQMEALAITSCLLWQQMETSHSTVSSLHALHRRWHLL